MCVYLTRIFEVFRYLASVKSELHEILFSGNIASAHQKRGCSAFFCVADQTGFSCMFSLIIKPNV